MSYKSIIITLFFTLNLFAQNKNTSLGFKENKGQIIDQNGHSNNTVKYLLNTNGLNVQLKKNGFSYDVYEVKKHVLKERIEDKNSFISKKSEDKKTPEYSLEYIFHRIDIDFLYSNPNVELITDEKSKDYDNYYNIPNHPEGIINVHQYQQITYKNIYPNIDIVFSIPKDSLKAVEYNFVIHPNGKASDIQLKFNGTQTELVNNKIKMKVCFGEMEEILPASWTEDGKNKKYVNTTYKKIKKNVYGFDTSNIENGETLIIDPVPVRLWGTFYGGTDWTESATIDKDDLGNIYFAGKTASITTISTSGSHQSTTGFVKYPGLITWDGYIAKFDSNGNRIWATYYGGNYDDNIKSIKVSQNKDLIFCGNTNSSNNISTIGTFKENKSGSYSEMFLGKLNSNGIRKWATYYGNDNGQTFANSVAADQQNNIYLSGATKSDDFISTPNSFKETFIDNNRFDGFLAKFDTNGNRIWGTYFGGDKDDFFEDSAIDKDGNIILVGYTQSDNNIASTNSYQSNYNMGDSSSNGDGMIVKFNTNGQRIWSTYFGDQKSDWIYNCKIYGDHLYFTGETENNNIATPYVFEPTMKTTYRSSYFAKFNLNTQKLTWLSYCQAKVTSIFPKNDNEVFITGETTYGFEIACPNAYNPINSLFSGFIIKLDVDCKKIWGTYFGRSSIIRTPIVMSEEPNAFFVTGNDFSNSPDNNISSSGAYIEIPNGSPQSFLMKFTEDILSTPLISTNSPVCIGNDLELKASGGTNYLWSGPNGFNSTEQNPTIINTTDLNSGEYSCLITGTGGCDDTKKTTVAIITPQLPTADSNQSFCSTQNATLGDVSITGENVKWYDNINSGSLLPENTILVDGVIYYASQTVNNCESDRLAVTVSIVNTPSAPTANSTISFCKKENPTLNDIPITGEIIKWYDTNFSSASLPNTTLLEDNKTYYASQTIGCESDRIPVLTRVYNTPLPVANKTQLFCIDENATISTISISGTNIKWYDQLTDENLLEETTILEDGKTYYATQTLNSCESERLAITVNIQNTQTPIAISPQTFCIQKNAKISDIVISGQNINWFNSSSSSTYLSENTILENGTTYYASSNVNNCESERISVAITILEATTPECINYLEELPFPKFFTPNNDGYNDTWTIDFAYLTPKTDIKIFDRYGKLLKVLLPNTSWNGLFNNQQLPADDYWFIVTRIDGKEFKGHFSLKR